MIGAEDSTPWRTKCETATYQLITSSRDYLASGAHVLELARDVCLVVGCPLLVWRVDELLVIDRVLCLLIGPRYGRNDVLFASIAWYSRSVPSHG